MGKSVDDQVARAWRSVRQVAKRATALWEVTMGAAPASTGTASARRGDGEGVDPERRAMSNELAELEDLMHEMQGQHGDDIAAVHLDHRPTLSTSSTTWRSVMAMCATSSAG